MKDGPNCRQCPLYEQPGPVWGEGHPDSRLIIIGQCPGPDEIKSGRPFTGGSGRILDNSLYRTGRVQRPSTFVTNVVKCFVPPGQPVPNGAVRCCAPLLEKELNTVSGKVILTLGGEAFNALTKIKSFQLDYDRKAAKKDPAKAATKWIRGAVFTWEEGQRSVGGFKSPCPDYLRDRIVIPTAHPSFIARTGFELAPIFDIDVDRAGRFALGQATLPSDEFIYNPSDADVRDVIEECWRSGEFGLDIETPQKPETEEDALAGNISQIDCIGISPRRGFTLGVSPGQFDLLQSLFEGVPGKPRVRMFDFNDGFDGYHLKKRWNMQGVEANDVMLMLHHCFSMLRSKNLAVALSIFTDLPFHKNLEHVCPDLYNHRDTTGALEAGQNAMLMMKALGIDCPAAGRTAWENTKPLPQILADMRAFGACVDVDKANRHLVAMSRAYETYEKAWYSVPNLAMFSPTSPKQLLTLFTQVMKLPVQYNTKEVPGFGKKKVPTCDEDALLTYRDKHGSKVAGMVLDMRQIKHTMDVLQWYNPTTERLHPRYKAHGQVGHRLQAVDPAVQTISEEMYGINPREMVVGDWDPIDNERQLIMVADFSQIEWRLYMYQANDRPGIEALEKEIYVYGQLYEEIFKEPFFKEGCSPTKYNKRSDIPPWKLLVAKSGPLGWIYGRTDFTGLGIPKDHANLMARQMDREHPAVLEFHRRKLEEVRKKGYAQSVFGRIRRFPGSPRPTEVFSFYGQTTAVDVLCANALIPFSLGLAAYRSRTLFTVHDSVVLSVPRTLVAEVGAYVKATMESPITQLNGLKIPVEIKVGPNWGNNTLLEKYLANTEGANRAVSQPA